MLCVETTTCVLFCYCVCAITEMTNHRTCLLSHRKATQFLDVEMNVLFFCCSQDESFTCREKLSSVLEFNRATS